MKDSKGFDDWIPIFKGGKQIDGQGREHDGDKLIKKAIETFDLEEHEPPVCVGHPQNNAPAFGWVQGLKKAGNILYAKFKAVVPEFEEAVKKGLYKKRSASFYPDGRLRHVGFLGAAPPAVKGLAGIKFEDQQEALSFDFFDPDMSTIARIFRSIRDWLIEKEGKDAADSIIPDWDVDYLKTRADKHDEADAVPAFSRFENNGKRREEKDMKDTMFKMLQFMGFNTDKIPEDALPGDPVSANSGNFSEADIKAAQDAAVKTEREKVAIEFTEKERQAKQAARQAKIPVWCDQMVKEGKLTPALVKYGVPDILAFLAASDDVIEFGEEKTKATAFDQLIDLFEAQLPKIVNFGEVASRKTDTGGKDAKERIEEMIRKKMDEDKNMPYGLAFAEVQNEHPALIKEYIQEAQ